MEAFYKLLRNQTLLHRNAAGYYEFSHKSLAEYFVAFKFASELGCLKSEFEKSYQEGEANFQNPIKKKTLFELSESFGYFGGLAGNRKMEAIYSFLTGMYENQKEDELWSIILETRDKDPEKVKYTGGNTFNLIRSLRKDFTGMNLSKTVLTGINLENANLEKTNFQGAFMREGILKRCSLIGANFSETDLCSSSIHFSKIDFTSSNFRRSSILRIGYDFYQLKPISCQGMKIYQAKGLEAKTIELYLETSKSIEVTLKDWLIGGGAVPYDWEEIETYLNCERTDQVDLDAFRYLKSEDYNELREILVGLIESGKPEPIPLNAFFVYTRVY